MANAMTLDDKVALINSYEATQEQIINLLFKLQSVSEQHYIDGETAKLVGDYMDMPVSAVYELCSYYPLINTTPQAKYVLKLDNAAPATLLGGKMIRETLQNLLGVPEDTLTDDGLFAYKGVSALGESDQDPFIKVGTKVFGNLDAGKIKQLISDLKDGRYDNEL